MRRLAPGLAMAQPLSSGLAVTGRTAANPSDSATAAQTPDGQWHRFTPALPRQRGHGGVCEVCDSAVDVHAGSVVSRRYQHRLLAR